MAPLVSVIEVARPPEEVFAVATDPERFAEWQRDVVRVRMLGEARFATTRRMSGGERTVVQEVTRNEPPKVWSARGVGGPIRPHATISIEPMDDGAGSRVTFSLDFEGHGLGIPLLPMVRRQAERAAPGSYEKLRKLLESEPA